MKKKVLIAYDSMMLGGTTTALKGLLSVIDYEKFDVDLLLYSQKTGRDVLERLPKEINLLPEAQRYNKKTEKVIKLIISLLNGMLFKGFFCWLKYKNNHAKKLSRAIWQSLEKAHVAVSAPTKGKYDVAIGFIESWAAHYVVSDKVDAKKRVIWVHLDVNKSYMLPEMDLYMYKKADSIVTVSEECCENLKKNVVSERDKICCIENVLPKSEVLLKAESDVDFNVDENFINLVSVCRIAYIHKGIDRGLNAFKRLKDEGTLGNIRWFLIGNGEDYKATETFIEENGLKNHIFLLGAQTNPFPYEKKMTMFFLPSRYEGKPMAVTEAQMLGLPCAVTHYASASEQVINERDGILMENSDEAVYEFLKRLSSGGVNIELLKKNVLEKDFSDKVTVKKLEEIME